MDISQIDVTLSKFFAENYTPTRVEELADTFHRYGFVNFDENSRLVPDELNAAVLEESRLLAMSKKERRDLLLKTTGNTPRHLSIVKSEDIEPSELINTIGRSEVLLDFLGNIARERIIPEVSDDERYVITYQEYKSDTHGWHWGDYSFALIWTLIMPPIEHGGMLQCVPHTHWDKSNPRINETLCSRQIDTHGFKAGDIYLLRTDTTLHRTVPLSVDSPRMILNMTWASERDLQRPLAGDDRWFQNPEVQAVTALAKD
jgi:hypothetical protein